MNKKRYNRGTRGLQRLLNANARNYICKEVQEDIGKAMREAAKEWFENLPTVSFDFRFEPIEEGE